MNFIWVPRSVGCVHAPYFVVSELLAFERLDDGSAFFSGGLGPFSGHRLADLVQLTNQFVTGWLHRHGQPRTNCLKKNFQTCYHIVLVIAGTLKFSFLACYDYRKGKRI